MVYLEINKHNYHNLIDKLDKYMANKDNKIFMLIYMEGCGPCNETRPEWSKLKNILSNHPKNVIVVSIDKDLTYNFSEYENIKQEIKPGEPNLSSDYIIETYIFIL